jgi:hypothetical protein
MTILRACRVSKRVSATNPADAIPPLWSTGDYAYDGAGNITAIGTTQYQYDRHSRLIGTIVATATGTLGTSFFYDVFGNRRGTGTRSCSPTGCLSSSVVPFLMTGTTNHYATYTYDDAGSVTNDGQRLFSYDIAGMMMSATVQGGDFRYLYTADDERIAVVQRTPGGRNRTTWELRGFDNQFLDDATRARESSPARRTRSSAAASSSPATPRPTASATTPSTTSAPPAWW